MNAINRVKTELTHLNRRNEQKNIEVPTGTMSLFECDCWSIGAVAEKLVRAFAEVGEAAVITGVGRLDPRLEEVFDEHPDNLTYLHGGKASGLPKIVRHSPKAAFIVYDWAPEDGTDLLKFYREVRETGVTVIFVGTSSPAANNLADFVVRVEKIGTQAENVTVAKDRHGEAEFEAAAPTVSAPTDKENMQTAIDQVAAYMMKDEFDDAVLNYHITPENHDNATCLGFAGYVEESKHILWFLMLLAYHGNRKQAVSDLMSTYNDAMGS